MLISNWLDDTSAKLASSGIASGKLDARLILEKVIGKSTEWVLAHGDAKLSDAKLVKLHTLVTRRAAREPLAYIFGSKEFYGRNFMVNKHTLVPRPESESIIKLLRKLDLQSGTVLDVGTGTGCLAITAKYECPNLEVVATDVDTDTLATATENAKINDASVTFFRADLLSGLPQSVKPSAVLANLPYVPSGLVTSPEIQHEPVQALFSGTDGLDLYRRFWKEIITIDHKPQFVITESLEAQHEQVAKLARTAGYMLEGVEGLAQLFALGRGRASKA